MNRILAIFIGLLILAVLLLFSMTYTVSYHEVAIRTRFGKTGPDSVITEPGLQFKLPIFADKVTKLDTRVQLVESSTVQIQTADDLQLVVKAFLLWQVDTEGDGPLNFYEAYERVENARTTIEEDFRSALKSSASQYAYGELVGDHSRLANVEENVKQVMMRGRDRGVLPVSVGISQVVLPPSTTRAVLTRMKETRERLSQAERMTGTAEKDRIEGAAKTQKEKIEAFARNRAAEIRAEGNVLAEKYLQDMGRDPELAIFLEWLDALETSLSQYTTVILPMSMAPFHLMNLDSPVGADGIPQPAVDGRVLGLPEKAGDSGDAAAEDSSAPSGSET
jgi:regulator of protease activity HflC (stomatin/prohibitin superfamily)